MSSRRSAEQLQNILVSYRRKQSAYSHRSDVLGRLPFAVEEWWNRNKDQLTRLGMHFSGYAWVTTLKDDPSETH
jgi:hypothetical protein